MQSRLITLLTFVFALTLIGCGGPEPAWVYGEWRETLNGDVVEFREDKTVNWFGTEGTYSFGRNAQLLCLDRCADGQLKIHADGETYRAPYYVNHSGVKWDLRFHSTGGFTGLGVSDYVVQGKRTDRVSLIRASSFNGPLVLDGTERFDANMGVYYPWISKGGRVNGELVAHGGLGLIRLDESTNRWETIYDGNVSNAYFGQEVILYEAIWNHYYSIDNGATFHALPDFSDVVDNYSLWDLNFIGKTLYHTVQEAPVVEGDWETLCPYTVYSIDLSASSPEWKAAHRFSTDFVPEGSYLKAAGSEAVGELYLIRCRTMDSNAAPEVCNLFRSQDEASTWEAMPDLPTASFRDVESYSNGIVGKYQESGDGVQPQHVLWYRADSGTWEDVIIPQEARFYSFSVQGDTLVHWNWSNQLRRLHSDGTLEVLGTYNNLQGIHGNTPNMTVVDDYIFLNAGTVWRVPN